MANSNEIVQIEQIDKQLNTLNTSINNTSTNYLKLVKTIADNSVVIKEQAITFENVAKAQKQTQDTAAQLDALSKQLAQSELKLKQLEDGRIETLIKNRIAIQNTTKEIANKVKAQNLEAGSLDAMRVKLSQLIEVYDKSGTRTKAAADEINKLSREIGKAEAATNRHQRGVGGYADQLGKFKGIISGLPGPLGGAASAAEGLITKLGAFGPVGLWIGGTILSIGAPLAAFFLKSEQGADMLERKFAGFKASIAVLTGELIKSGKKMAEAFDEPEKKTQIFWTTFLGSMNPAWIKLGANMDIAAVAAENYTKKIQDLEDSERALIVPRAQASFKIKEAMILYYDVNKSLDERMNGLKTAIELESKTADVEQDHAKQIVENIKVINKEKERAGQLRDEDDKKLQEAIAKVTDLETESLGRQMRSTQRLAVARNNILAEQKTELEERKKLAEEKEKLAQKEIDMNYHIAESLAKQQEERESKTIDASKKIADQLDKDQELADKRNEEIVQGEIDKNAAIIEANTKRNEQIEEEEIKKAEMIRDIQIQMASEAINGIFDMGSAKRDQELSALDKEKDAKLSNTKLTAEQKHKIELEYDKKAAEIKTKQAKADKLQAMFNIALNTGVGVMKATAEGLLPLIPWIIALGALQMGLVSAQPIPKFAKGTSSAPDKGIFGEAGRELMILRDNSVLMAEKPTYFDGNKFKGARIYSNPETEQLINSEHISGGRQITDDRILRGLSNVEQAIRNKPVAIFDNEYKPIGQAYSNHQTIYLNKLTRMN